MEKLKTNELSLGLNQTFRNDLVDNFKKIQNGVDGQSDALNKQITDLLGDVTPQGQNEVTQARIDVHGNHYGTLKSRADATQATAETALSEERNTSAEVQNARTNSNSQTYPTLKARMDGQENDLNNSINYKLSQISSVPETFANLAALKSKYPTGKIGLFVTANTGHKYIWDNSTWTDAGVYNSVGIADGAVSLMKISPKAVDILASQSQNYSETAISLGYKRFITFPVEGGGIISTTGNNIDDHASIRSKSKIKFESNNLLFVLKDPNVRIRLFVYNRSGAFETVTKWFNDKEAYTVDTSKLYRIEINTIDDKALDLEYGYSACKIVYQNEKISNFDTLEDELTNINNTVSDRFDYNETAVNLGYRRFVTFPVEGGGIISTTGNNIDDHASIRSKSKIKFESNNLLFVLKDPNVRIRLFVYNQSGVFEGLTKWISDKGTFVVDMSKLYRIEINTIDDKALDLEYGYSACKIVYQNEKISNFDTLEDKLTKISDTVSNRFDYEKNPTNFGYNQFNIYKYEYGGINSSNGNDLVSSDSIRTLKNNLITFDSAVTVINLAASKYRIKFVAYNDNWSLFDAGLWVNADKNTFALDLSKHFRVQIATMDGSAIDLEKALQNVKIVYADNIVANLPRYWQKYLDKRISEVKPELSKGTDLSAMLITTDTHFVFNNVNEINPAVAKYICDKMGIGTLLHLGDTIAENASKSIATERMNYVMSKYRDAADNFYAIRGNHDDNNEGSLYPYSSCITQKESYSWMFRRNDPRVVMGETGTYYYVDNEFEKTRMIFLDVIDFPYADNGSNKIKEKYLAWGIKQLDWFANKALKVPEGYSIAIFNHTPIVESIVTREHGASTSRQTLPKNAQQMIEILEAYVTRSKKDITINLTDVNSFKYFNGVVSVDFTQSTGKIIGWFCGHEHIDDIQDIGSTGIKNVIILNNSANFGPEIISSTYQPKRKMFDTTEEVYDLLIIDKSSQKVTLERFGAGNKTARSFNY